MRRPLPRFMKPGQKNSLLKGGRFGRSVKRRDSIRVNKEKMDRKKRHRLSGSGTLVSEGVKVEEIPPTPPTGKQGRKTAKQAPTANPAHE